MRWGWGGIGTGRVGDGREVEGLDWVIDAIIGGILDGDWDFGIACRVSR